MPNQRAENMVLVNCWMDADLVDEMDRVARLEGHDRSQFLRFALKEKLRGMGVVLHDDKFLAPPRTRPRGAVRYKLPRQGLSSKPPSRAKAAAEKAAASARHHDPKS